MILVAKNNYCFLLLAAAVISSIFTSVVSEIHMSSVYGQVQSNFTSTVCNADGTCITTICINNEPCHTVKSNSTSVTTGDNSTPNQNYTNPLAGLGGGRII
jgi:hypothetical protein